VYIDGSLVVATVGCLHYERDLVAGSAPAESAAQAIAHAYRHFGAALVDRVEGDLSFIVWDEAQAQLLAWRSFPGPYPLFYARSDSGCLVVATSIEGALAVPGVRPDLNAPAIAESAAGLLFGEHRDTCRSAVQRLDPGHALKQRNVAMPQQFRVWAPDVFEGDSAATDGVEALRLLLADAVHERTSANAPTAVWLSGGYDSTAVFSTAMWSRQSDAPPILPVSIHYPPGDIGHEDEWIEATARRWDTQPSWIDIDSITVPSDLVADAARRDEPFTHLFDTWNEALGSKARALGCSVALGGDGGDQLFQSAPIHLADLAARGRLVGLIREWRSLGGRSLGGLARWGLAPLAPRRIARIYERFRGMPYPDTQRMRAPAWVRPDFVRSHDLLGRNREHAPPGAVRTYAGAEAFRMASSPFFGRVATAVREAARRGGVRHASPLWDTRVIRFALSRPFAERVARGESKRMLRAAVKGLAPDDVLAPRPHRTGAPDRIFLRAMDAGVLPFLDHCIADLRLADMGIVEPSELARAIAEHRRRPGFYPGVLIAFTAHTEAWLRSRA